MPALVESLCLSLSAGLIRTLLAVTGMAKAMDDAKRAYQIDPNSLLVLPLCAILNRRLKSGPDKLALRGVQHLG
jgi:hypothetical protein